ncbi:MAG: DedA family protein [Moorellaceae bacterium]
MAPGHVYWLLFSLLFIEGVGFPLVPFEPVFIAAGYLIERGEMSFWGAVLLGTAGNLLGNLLGYWLGARAARPFLERLARWSLGPQAMERAGSWFRRYGPAVVIISRWFGPIRTPAIIYAAPLGMTLVPYTVCSAIGAFTWALAWQFASWKGVHFLEAGWQVYRRYSAPWLDCLLLTLLVVAVIASGCYFKKWRQRSGA